MATVFTAGVYVDHFRISVLQPEDDVAHLYVHCIKMPNMLYWLSVKWSKMINVSHWPTNIVHYLYIGAY